MNHLIQSKLEDISTVCAKHRVRRLDLFGSAASADESAASDGDVDFLVDFLPLQAGEHADAYFGLLEALEELLDRRVDLVMARAIKNPYFLEAIRSCRTVVYAA